jgi:hypothetical protein
MYLETKKEQRDGEEMDAVNLRTLRGLIAGGDGTPANSRRKKADSRKREGEECSTAGMSERRKKGHAPQTGTLPADR